MKNYQEIKWGGLMGDKSINVVGETCPVPLVEMRKAVRKASPGDIIEITGDHTPSKKEIPMAVESLGMELLEVKEEDDRWTIRIKVREG